MRFPYEIQPDAETVRLYEVAARIGAQTEDGTWWSFSSVLLAFRHLDLSISHWFIGYLGGAGVSVDAILREKKLSSDALQGAVAGGEPAGGQPRWTRSAREVFLSSVLLAEKVGHDDGAGPRVGLRHVMGAYCAFHYPNHEKQLRSWGFVPQSWFLAFHDYLAPSSIGREELGRWRELGEELALFGREGVRLRDALGELYPKESDARRFLADAGLDVRLFTLSGSAQDIWFDVITKVGKNNQIGVLLATARKEYPKSPLLASLRGF